MISAEAPVVFAKACEIFILELTLRAWMHTDECKRRTLQKNDVAVAVSRSDIFDFLIDIVPREDSKVKKPEVLETCLSPCILNTIDQYPSAITAEQGGYYFGNNPAGMNFQVSHLSLVKLPFILRLITMAWLFKPIPPTA